MIEYLIITLFFAVLSLIYARVTTEWWGWKVFGLEALLCLAVSIAWPVVLIAIFINFFVGED